MANKGKGDLNYNFEMLKEQMKKKREIAESISKNEEEKEIHDISEALLDKGKQEVNTEDKIIENEKELSPIFHVKEEKQEEQNVSGKIVIKKVVKPEAPKRITYYLKPETIKKIDKFSKMAGMGKSEFVQKILEEALNNLEIEK
ncbi:hypothetical protein [Clostridium fallax]|uniref:Ribbon-helix-helix protein, copG family n=1 Tax=Clostridium fallax TaxID=1533 RepID=A0A1M4YF28_9CLOT|nr:hypothetical protein [Clostridium fallax]SHF04350.1 hypothetical protein SAMN05443638_12717 [Clostridium fallax]SQB22319.1 Uncharacterised protein [Clostridium fallax]